MIKDGDQLCNLRLNYQVTSFDLIVSPSRNSLAFVFLQVIAGVDDDIICLEGWDEDCCSSCTL